MLRLVWCLIVLKLLCGCAVHVPERPPPAHGLSVAYKDAKILAQCVRIEDRVVTSLHQFLFVRGWNGFPAEPVLLDDRHVAIVEYTHGRRANVPHTKTFQGDFGALSDDWAALRVRGERPLPARASGEMKVSCALPELWTPVLLIRSDQNAGRLVAKGVVCRFVGVVGSLNADGSGVLRLWSFSNQDLDGWSGCIAATVDPETGLWCWLGIYTASSTDWMLGSLSYVTRPPRSVMNWLLTGEEGDLHFSTLKAYQPRMMSEGELQDARRPLGLETLP